MGKSPSAENVPESFGFGRKKNRAGNVGETEELGGGENVTESDRLGGCFVAAEYAGFGNICSRSESAA
jgi:hypothetical protein